MFSIKPMIFMALAAFTVTACGRMGQIGKEPEFSPSIASEERTAMVTEGMPTSILPPEQTGPDPSLWTGDRGSLLGDRRAGNRGDIMTVVIEINDRASISNSSDRSRSASQDMAIPQLFGLPQRANTRLPEGATLDPAVQLSGSSSASGDGSVTRNEQLTLRIAATIVDVLPNGVLAISGRQEVRVNFELRELLVTGYVRPEDITRQNEITYDKIAAARISYGGRGQITEMQQPRYGHQAAEILLPF